MKDYNISEVARHTDGSHSLASVVICILKGEYNSVEEGMIDLRDQNKEDYAINGICNFEYDLSLIKKAVKHFEEL